MTALTALTGLGLFAAIAAVGVALDPYDTGRFALLRVRGVPEQGPRTANASRARDPAFDAAIIGNSHVQLLSPERLTELTGVSFVSLATPALTPPEGAALLRYFIARRERPAQALVLGVDGFWCTPDIAQLDQHPFPFWLYRESARDYLGGLVGWGLLDLIGSRVRYALGFERRARPDGYWDYTALLTQEAKGRNDLDRPYDYTPLNLTGRYPAVDLLRELLAGLPPDLPVVALRPPVYITGLPLPGSAAERAEAACREEVAAAVAARPRTALVDWRVDRPETREKEGFIDHSHYGQSLARAVEADIAAALARIGADPVR